MSVCGYGCSIADDCAFAVVSLGDYFQVDRVGSRLAAKIPLVQGRLGSFV